MSIDQQSVKPLLAVCRELGLPESVQDGMVRQVHFLRLWKAQVLPNDKTPAQRVRQLARIERLAMELGAEVEGLTLGDRWQLDDAIFGTVVDISRDQAASAVHDFAGQFLPHVQAAAFSVRASIEGEVRAGRQAMTERQADFIRCIAQGVKAAGMVPTWTGDFRRLCEAVFLAGGVTFPDRAMRHFMKEIRPTLKADGLCL